MKGGAKIKSTTQILQYEWVSEKGSHIYMKAFKGKVFKCKNTVRLNVYSTSTQEFLSNCNAEEEIEMGYPTSAMMTGEMIRE